MDSEHTGLLFHSEIRWLARGTVLKRLFELRHEDYLFLKNITPLSSHFGHEASLCRLPYLTDILSKLNYLTFLMEDKVHVFYRKLLVRQGRVKSGNLTAFPTMLDFLDVNNRNEPAACRNSIPYFATHGESVTAIPVILPILDRRLRWCK
jgi:hypothetical protein